MWARPGWSGRSRWRGARPGCSSHTRASRPAQRNGSRSASGSATGPTGSSFAVRWWAPVVTAGSTRRWEAALAVCLRCPLLPACQRYADASREPFTFLAGMTAAERRARHTKKTEIAKRRQQVDALRALGAPTGVIAEILGRDSSLIRGDIRTLDQSRPTAA
jgi:hypothetical protein